MAKMETSSHRSHLLTPMSGLRPTGSMMYEQTMAQTKSWDGNRNRPHGGEIPVDTTLDAEVQKDKSMCAMKDRGMGIRLFFAWGDLIGVQNGQWALHAFCASRNTIDFLQLIADMVILASLCMCWSYAIVAIQYSFLIIKERY
jgi:hypothetical protein